MNRPIAGPWKVYDDRRYPNPTIEVQDRRGKPIVHWMGFDSSDRLVKYKRANARLIAAAPDLLAACQQMSDGYGDKADELKALKAIRAAISKS